MFTGIIENLGEVTAVQDTNITEDHKVRQVRRLRVRATTVLADLKPGDSIAVNGVCLTVTETSDDQISAEMMTETLDRTSLGSLTVGSPVNLERPAALGVRMGGHLVQGHVDGVGRIAAFGPDDVVRIELPERLSRYVVPKGSIAVDGISLTVVDAGATSFTVALIPTTFVATTLGAKQVGDLVNLEVDVIAKYLEQLVGVGR